MSDKSQAPPSWWQTVPGILTGVAAIITAVTGLVIAFNHTGNRSEETTLASLSAPGGPQPPVSAADSPPPRPAGSGGRAQSIALPPVNPVKLAAGDAVITILSAEVEPLDAESRSLTFGLRYLNAGRYPASFGSGSYRL